MIKVIIFGAGNRTERIINELRNDVILISIVDNDCLKWGREICGVKVTSPDQIVSLVYDFIVIVPIDYYLIQKQLTEYGVLRKNIINCTCYEKVCVAKEIQYYGRNTDSMEKQIVAFSHALNSTGAQNVLVTSLVEFVQLGYDITVISTSDGELREEFIQAGINVYIVPDLYTHKEWIEELVDGVELVLINTLLLYYIIEDFNWRSKKSIWWIHESTNIEFMDKRVFEICKRKRVQVFAVSEVVKDAVCAIAPEEVIIDILRFGVPEYEIGKKRSEKINVVVLAAMAYMKGQDIFMEAVRQLPDPIKRKANFYVIGGGRRTEELLCKSYESGVHMINEVPKRKVPEIYERTDILVCPSRKEGMSVTVIEAMMHGIVTIVSDAAGVAQYIDHGNDGFVFESENCGELSEILNVVISDDEKRNRIGRNGRKIYDEFFSMDIHRNNLKSI
jgi:glycosyltransferase involved in cell wall biosynthesis